MYFYATSAALLLVIALALEIGFREHLFRHLKARILWSLLFFTLGMAWDIYALYFRHWVFTGKGVVGVFIGLVPVEDILWLLFVPYFCLTVYKMVHILSDRKGAR